MSQIFHHVIKYIIHSITFIFMYKIYEKYEENGFTVLEE